MLDPSNTVIPGYSFNDFSYSQSQLIYLTQLFDDISSTLSGLHKYLVDKTASSIILHRNFNRSKRVSPARAVIPSQRGVSIAILGAICELGIINVSLRKPPSVQSNKKRKQNDGTTLLDACIGTRTEHFIELSNQSIACLAEQRGYK
ncbi:hypothetical protein INT45_012388 [Circinella minor]|uniref:Uncharacterized protein n=1 Tax=Circinella minor TaxID=1195481 RepID=A0A8H7S1Q6_9FUNG|nr:hypothetical protein INT45_012388 [Circinella minor]